MIIVTFGDDIARVLVDSEKHVDVEDRRREIRTFLHYLRRRFVQKRGPAFASSLRTIANSTGFGAAREVERADAFLKRLG